MNLERLHNCPMHLARSLFYERFHEHSGRFTHIWEPPSASASLLDLSSEIPNTARVAYLVTRNGERSAIYSVKTEKSDVYVLVDSFYKEAELSKVETKHCCFITITSQSNEAVFETLSTIEQLTTGGESTIETWLRSQENGHE